MTHMAPGSSAALSTCHHCNAYDVDTTTSIPAHNPTHQVKHFD